LKKLKELVLERLNQNGLKRYQNLVK
jgi:hypothetical protein